MTGTFWAFARDCDDRVDIVIESAPATTTAARASIVKRFMNSSPRKRAEERTSPPHFAAEQSAVKLAPELYLRAEGRSSRIRVAIRPERDSREASTDEVLGRSRRDAQH